MRGILLLLLGLALFGHPAASRHEGNQGDFSGTWAQLQVTSEISIVPFVGEVTNKNITLLRLVQEQNGNQLKVIADVCSIRVESGTSMVSIEFPQAFVDSLGMVTKRSTIEPADHGYRFFQPPVTTLRGVHLENPESDPLPREAGDPRVFDQDDDGKPGVTVRITILGLISGEVYLIQRDWSSLTGRAGTLDRIDGLIDWGIEQVVLGASNPFLKARGTNRPDPVAAHSYF
ncbi:MAG: hypothetical protein GWN58_21130, partial [Anaerolineae bacterium]|nr:hypothetical protein [Anaerolineae bacterium]